MRLRRGVVFGGLALAHLLILAVVLRPVLVPAASDPSIAVVSIAETPVALPAAVPPLSEVAVEASVALPELVGEVGGGDCAVAEAVGRALAADPAALAALAAIPAADRSVANTAMVWDGGWSTAAGGAPAIRAVVAAAVRDAPAACSAAQVIGPRLIFISESGGIALAFGSGSWSWADVLK